MLTDTSFSARSMSLFNARNMSQGDVDQFADILNRASRAERSGQSAKSFLQTLSREEMSVVQKAHCLANTIDISVLSGEGAQNLLTHPDNSGKVDLNNDGIVEVGEAKNIIFPPVNAPDFVKKAYEEAVAGKEGLDLFSLELRMHTQIYGVRINDTATKQPLSPEQQWSPEGIDNMFKSLYSNLDFRVGMEGWTEQNKNLQSFYQDFETALKGEATRLAPASDSAGTTSTETKDASREIDDTQFDSINQLILDARLGIDRKKLEEIDAKIAEIANNEELSDEEKYEQIAALMKEKETLVEEAIQRTTEQEKRKALLSPSMLITEQLHEDKLKQQIGWG